MGWSESPKQVLSDGHVVERCGVLDEFILIFILCSIVNLCSIFAQHGQGELTKKMDEQREKKKL